MNLSLEYLEHFFHGTPAGIALMTSRIIAFANSQMSDITGYSKKELVGKHAGIFYPNERESKRIEKAFYPLLKKKGMGTIETKWRSKSGDILDVFLGGVLLDYKVNLEKSDYDKDTILIMVFDITERRNLEGALRKNEMDLREALESTGEGFWDWGIESGSVQFNDAWIKMLGYKRKEIESHIRSWQKLIHPDDWHRVRKALNDHLWSNAESYATEYRLKAKSGKWIWVFDYGKVIDKDTNHYPLRFIATSTEITSLKKIQQKSFALENQEVTISSSESSFPRRIFRKKTIPAKGMEGFLRLLQNPYVNRAQRDRYLDLMLNSGSQIREFIHNLMNVSRLNSAQLDVRPEEFNINTMLHGLHDEFFPLAKDKEIYLKLYTPLTDDESFIYSDETKLRQILRYLLDNAVSYTETGVIEFGYQMVDNEMRFFVKDTGKGIGKDQENKIFEPFYTSVDTAETVGAGLGLTVAGGLAELLNGKIWVQSEEGEGSIFYLTIPYISGKQDVHPEKDNISKEEFQPEIMVLIVEDDRSNAIFLDEVLKSPELRELHLNTQFATNGREAVDFCKNNKVDIVLMDIKLPVMDGITACRKIRLLKPQLPIIAQTAYAYPSDKENIFAAGCNDYLVKPISVNMICQKLKKCLMIRNGKKAFYEN